MRVGQKVPRLVDMNRQVGSQPTVKTVPKHAEPLKDTVGINHQDYVKEQGLTAARDAVASSSSMGGVLDITV